MRVREVFESATYGPDQIKIMSEALETVWVRIAPSIGPDPQAVETARLRLARVILDLADQGLLTPQELTEAAHASYAG
jgi:hypothetical protein